MSYFNFFKAEKVYGELYLQFPRVLLYSTKYSKLSDSAKIAYMVFRDRLHYSLKNNWVDKESNVYFIFTNNELGELLNKSENTVTKIRKELVTAGLLMTKKMGFDPIKKKNNPDHLYLADLEVEATDVYLLQKQSESLSNQGTVTIEARHTGIETPVNQETAEIVARDKVLESHLNQGTANNEVNLYLTKSSKDSKENKDRSDSELISQAFNPATKNPEQEEPLIESYIKESSFHFIYGEELMRVFKIYCFNDFETFKTYCNKLVFAHKSVEKEKGLSLSIFEGTDYCDYARRELKNTFMRCIQTHRYGKANNIASYLFVSFKNVFESLAKVVVKGEVQQEGEKVVPLEF